MTPHDPIKNDLDLSADVQVAQMVALDALFDANRGQGPAARAIDLARELRELLPLPASVEMLTIDIALAHILEGEPRGVLPEGPSPNLPWFDHAVEEVCLAWGYWVAHQDRRAVGLSERLQRSAPTQDNGALSLPAIYDWARAVEALVHGNLDECRRYFDRASELSAQVALETHETLLWTYGATFFSLA